MLGLLFNLIRNKSRQRISDLDRFTKRFAEPLESIGKVASAMTFICACGLLICVAIYVGYDHDNKEMAMLRIGIRISQIIFTLNVLFNLLFHRGRTVRGSKILSWTVNILLFLTILPWVFHRAHLPGIPWLSAILYSNYFLFGALIFYAIVEISFFLMGLVNKHTNPSFILSGSFIVLILIGTFMLMLPRCSYYGIHFTDAIFLSTSAICITGLSPIDISADLTPFGIGVLAILIQIGSLGLLTFTSFFALFFTGSTSIFNQLLLRDIIYSKSLSNLIPTLLYVLGFTLAIEAGGALMIFLSIHDTLPLTLREEITFSLFHSLSSFCNAGFSTLPSGMANPLLLYHNMSIYWITTILIIAGGIGFPILVNFKDVTFAHLRRLWCRLTNNIREAAPVVHIWSMNTKIVLTTYFLLFSAGGLLFFIFEYDNTLSGMSLMQKITQSAFNSVTPRSAGFVSVDPSHFLSPTLMIVMFLMWVGGGSQSTAGGIKVNTFAAIWLNLRAILTGNHHVTAFKRNISIGSIRRANAVVALSLIGYTLFAVTIVALEPHLPVKAILFETLSALFTVGSSLGITPLLSPTSKLLMCLAMFLGRIGILTLLIGLAPNRSKGEVSYPSDNIIIN